MLIKKKRKNVLTLNDVEIRAWPEQNFLFGILGKQESGIDYNGIIN